MNLIKQIALTVKVVYGLRKVLKVEKKEIEIIAKRKAGEQKFNMTAYQRILLAGWKGQYQTTKEERERLEKEGVEVEEIWGCPVDPQMPDEEDGLMLHLVAYNEATDDFEDVIFVERAGKKDSPNYGFNVPLTEEIKEALLPAMKEGLEPNMVSMDEARESLKKVIEFMSNSKN